MAARAMLLSFSLNDLGLPVWYTLSQTLSLKGEGTGLPSSFDGMMRRGA